MMTLTETTPARYGWKPGQRDTYYKVTTWRYSDEDPFGTEETAPTLAAIRAIVAYEKGRADHEDVGPIVKVTVNYV